MKPIASTSLIIVLPHVANVPGPTSLPGGLRVCTRLSAGVIGPVKASALQPPFLESLRANKKGRLRVQI
jgi:hypothetical protein